MKFLFAEKFKREFSYSKESSRIFQILTEFITDIYIQVVLKQLNYPITMLSISIRTVDHMVIDRLTKKRRILNKKL